MRVIPPSQFSPLPILVPCPHFAGARTSLLSIVKGPILKSIVNFGKDNPPNRSGWGRSFRITVGQPVCVEITAKRDPTTLLLAKDSQGRNTRSLRLNHYGMRHRSMMRHCAAHPASLGFVVAQDGDIRAITAVGDSILVWETFGFTRFTMRNR